MLFMWNSCVKNSGIRKRRLVYPMRILAAESVSYGKKEWWFYLIDCPLNPNTFHAKMWIHLMIAIVTHLSAWGLYGRIGSISHVFVNVFSALSVPWTIRIMNAISIVFPRCRGRLAPTDPSVPAEIRGTPCPLHWDYTDNPQRKGFVPLRPFEGRIKTAVVRNIRWLWCGSLPKNILSAFF